MSKNNMIIVITGTPGTGKTTISKFLEETLNLPVINEKEFALKHQIGEYDKEEDELVIDLTKLEKEINKYLEKRKNAIIEGHLLAEIKIKADVVIVLTTEPEILIERLQKREYYPAKIQDNVFCEGIEYCFKHAKRNYPKQKIIKIDNSKSLSNTKKMVLYEIYKKINSK